MTDSRLRELVSRFSFRDPSLWFARARLRTSEINLTGWTWRGRYHRHIPFDRILHVNAKTDDELVLWLFDGEVLRLRIENAPTWKRAIDAARETASREGTSEHIEEAS